MPVPMTVSPRKSGARRRKDRSTVSMIETSWPLWSRIEETRETTRPHPMITTFIAMRKLLTGARTGDLVAAGGARLRGQADQDHLARGVFQHVADHLAEGDLAVAVPAVAGEDDRVAAALDR